MNEKLEQVRQVIARRAAAVQVRIAASELTPADGERLAARDQAGLDALQEQSERWWRDNLDTGAATLLRSGIDLSGYDG